MTPLNIYAWVHYVHGMSASQLNVIICKRWQAIGFALNRTHVWTVVVFLWDMHIFVSWAFLHTDHFDNVIVCSDIMQEATKTRNTYNDSIRTLYILMLYILPLHCPWLPEEVAGGNSLTTLASHASPFSIHPSHSSKQHSATYLSRLPLITPWSHHHSRPATQIYLHTCQCFSSSFPSHTPLLEMPPSLT